MPGRYAARRAQLSDRPVRAGRLLLAAALPLLIVAAAGWFWFASLVPATYSVMEMGSADYGGGPAVAHGEHSGDPSSARHGAAAVSVADLRGPVVGEPDMTATLRASKRDFRLASGEPVSGYTINGTSPGPVLRARQGDLVEVRLVNRDVAEGVSLHWHGIDVPNGEDGVAGVTQDAVPAGGRHVYRFVLPDAGTYWYHSHQVSHAQVRGGLLGAFVVDPASAPPDGGGSAGPNADDVLAVVHTYDGLRTVNGRTGVSRARVPAGTSTRVRVVNTDHGPLRLWVTGAAYRVLAVDGRDLLGPTPVEGKEILVPAGGRADLGVTVPAEGARVDLGGGAAVLLGPDGVRRSAGPQPGKQVDLLTYGRPAPSPFGHRRPDRTFDYNIGRRVGFLDGRPGFWWSINGRLFPDVPMYVVAEGDLVHMRIRNTSGDVHPMHLHGHHALVLRRDGVAATGSPWWVDSLEVEDGQTYEIAFVADNPGVWMDHCHNLAHAADGLVAHLAYAGVHDPYVVGEQLGEARNDPE